ncbi:MAG: hypothetical protein ABII79_03310 [bacterium]
MTAATKKTKRSDSSESKWPYGKKNYLVFAAALVVIILGYVTLGQGSITLAPILLVLGYCVLVPIALLIKGRPDNNDKPDQQPEN